MSIRKPKNLRGGRPLYVRAAGFTLVEVMVVVIVLGVVAGMLVPNLTGTGGGLRLDAAARRITSLFDYCYQSAMATGKVHGVVFDGDGRRFQIVRENPAEKAEDLASDAPPTLAPVSLPGVLEPELPEGISITSVAAFDASLISGGEAGEGKDGDRSFRILFFPDGTTEFATIKLSGPDGEGRKIMLNGLSGDVSIERLSREEIEEALQKRDGGDSGQEEGQ